jgi:hypothetical protein
MRANSSGGPLASGLAAMFPFSHGYKRTRSFGVSRNPSINFSTPSLFSVAQGHAFLRGPAAFSSAKTRGSPPQYGVAPRYQSALTTWDVRRFRSRHLHISAFEKSLLY